LGNRLFQVFCFRFLGNKAIEISRSKQSDSDNYRNPHSWKSRSRLVENHDLAWAWFSNWRGGISRL